MNIFGFHFLQNKRLPNLHIVIIIGKYISHIFGLFIYLQDEKLRLKPSVLRQ